MIVPSARMVGQETPAVRGGKFAPSRAISVSAKAAGQSIDFQPSFRMSNFPILAACVIPSTKAGRSKGTMTEASGARRIPSHDVLELSNLTTRTSEVPRG
jgi:hypothetical protein